VFDEAELGAETSRKTVVAEKGRGEEEEEEEEDCETRIGCSAACARSLSERRGGIEGVRGFCLLLLQREGKEKRERRERRRRGRKGFFEKTTEGFIADKPVPSGVHRTVQ
jgi:hypothetical protein